MEPCDRAGLEQTQLQPGETDGMKNADEHANHRGSELQRQHPAVWESRVGWVSGSLGWETWNVCSGRDGRPVSGSPQTPSDFLNYQSGRGRAPRALNLPDPLVTGTLVLMRVSQKEAQREVRIRGETLLSTHPQQQVPLKHGDLPHSTKACDGKRRLR